MFYGAFKTIKYYSSTIHHCLIIANIIKVNYNRSVMKHVDVTV